MQEDSDGRPGQGQQNQARNIQFLVLYDQNHPYTRRVRDSTPIQAGSVFGQAYFTDTENDGDSSMLYNNGIQPSQALHQPSSDVQRNFLPTQIENDTVVAQPSSDISRESPSFLGVDVRSGSRLPSTTPCQSASGLSTSSINRPPGGHLIVDNVQLQEPGVVVDLQRLRGMLKQRHGESKYQKDIQNCMRSFQQALFSEADASQYAIQLLYYLGESGLKCLDCKEIHNIGTVFRHKESCSVHICFQEILNAVGNQDTRQSNGANTNDRGQISEQRTSVPSPVPYSIEQDINFPMELLSLERMEIGQQEDRVARGINDGATGGPPSEETSYKAAYMPPSSFHSCSESRSFMQGFTTAPGPISVPNQVVYLPPGVPESGVNRPNRRLETSERQQFHHVQPQNYLADAGLFDIDSTLLAMGFTKEQIQGAINRFRKVNGSKEFTTEHLIEIIISDENKEGNLMNQSICGACSRREVGVSQFECGHIVCRTCAAQNVGDRCKICGKQVVKVVLFDAATLKK